MLLVTGHSGAGKSTLLKLIAGVERSTFGAVLVGGQNLGSLAPSPFPIAPPHRAWCSRTRSCCSIATHSTT
jgi:cell division transport system ATP-binding protein